MKITRGKMAKIRVIKKNDDYSMDYQVERSEVNRNLVWWNQCRQ